MGSTAPARREDDLFRRHRTRRRDLALQLAVKVLVALVVCATAVGVAALFLHDPRFGAGAGWSDFRSSPRWALAAGTLASAVRVLQIIVCEGAADWARWRRRRADRGEPTAPSGERV